MKQTTAPNTTPSPSPGVNKPKQVADKQSSAANQFIVAALNMSWQLAIVVLVPILVGSQLDRRLDMEPTLTLIGFVFAMIGTAYIMWKQLQLYGPNTTTRPKS